MNWIDKIKAGYIFKDKHENCYFLEKRKRGLFGDGNNEHYYIKCSEIDKGRGEVMFHENSLTVNFRFLGLEKFAMITENKITFVTGTKISSQLNNK